jgi:two-component system chemotaxis response regulator CheB
MLVQRGAQGFVLQLSDTAPENSCRPAVDVLFRSAATASGARTLAVILTGMGQDGLDGGRQIVAAGGELVAQDEASSVVWGMPGAVVRAELASTVVPLSAMAETIMQRVRSARALVSQG